MNTTVSFMVMLIQANIQHDSSKNGTNGSETFVFDVNFPQQIPSQVIVVPTSQAESVPKNHTENTKPQSQRFVFNVNFPQQIPTQIIVKSTSQAESDVSKNETEITKLKIRFAAEALKNHTEKTKPKKPKVKPVLDELKANGETASPEDFPFMAQIKDFQEYLCEGTIIDVNWVLTAAHCFPNLTGSGTLNVRVGLTEKKSGVEAVPVSKVFAHPKYKKTQLFNDLALLKLQHPLNISDRVRPIKIGISTLPEVVTAGWSNHFNDTKRLSQNLRFVNSAILDKDECKLTYDMSSSQQLFLQTNIICVKNEVSLVSSDGCVGGVASPLLQAGNEPLLVGMSTRMMCDKTQPAYFTRISAFLHWISKITRIAFKI